MKNLFFLSIVGAILILSSCQKEADSSLLPTPSATATQPTSTGQLKVATVFNWKTFKDIQLTLTGSANSIVEVTSPNQTVYQKVYLFKDKSYTMKLSVPAYETSVQLLYMGKAVTINLSSANIAHKFN
ncbi:MAG: hypothetical protein Q8908_03350 [Bacteroidota bacterium]|nr:hypothetical protein [Bacteroidota bacterium]